MDIGDYVNHAKIWDWGGRGRTSEHEYWLAHAKKYGPNVLIPMCALGEAGAYLAQRGCFVTAFDVTPEMIAEGKKRFGGIKNLDLRCGDIRGFCFDIPPADFAFVEDMGHLHTMGEVKAAIARIGAHLRLGGALMLEQPMPPKESSERAREFFYPEEQVYPGLRVYKSGETRHDADEKRTYIAQTVFIEHEGGETERFEHVFYLQWFERGELAAALNDGGFELKGEYRNREEEPWRAEDGLWIAEAVKKGGGKHE